MGLFLASSVFSDSSSSSFSVIFSVPSVAKQIVDGQIKFVDFKQLLFGATAIVVAPNKRNPNYIWKVIKLRIVDSG